MVGWNWDVGIGLGRVRLAGLGRAHDGREGRGWEGLVRVGCQGWLGCVFEVGCYWVPAPFGRLRAGSDAGMAEGKEDGRVTDAALTEDRTEGWFDTVFRGLQTGSPRTGPGMWFDPVFRGLQTGSPRTVLRIASDRKRPVRARLVPERTRGGRFGG